VVRPPLRVLVVTEDAAAAAQLARRFEAAGHAVSVTDGGPETLETVRRVMPDVVLLGPNHVSFPDRLRALRLDRYPLFVVASAGADELLRVLNSCAAALGG
jgi:DNA-binding response OmpR family regulator